MNVGALSCVYTPSFQHGFLAFVTGKPQRPSQAFFSLQHNNLYSVNESDSVFIYQTSSLWHCALFTFHYQCESKTRQLSIKVTHLKRDKRNAKWISKGSHSRRNVWFMTTLLALSLIYCDWYDKFLSLSCSHNAWIADELSEIILWRTSRNFEPLAR